MGNEDKMPVFKPLVEVSNFPPALRAVVLSMRSKTSEQWSETTAEWSSEQKEMAKLLRSKNQADRNRISRAVTSDLKATLEDENHPEFESTTFFIALSCLSDEQLDAAIHSFPADR